MADYIVNTERDDTEGDDQLLSLREAVALANANANVFDTIAFADGIDLVRLTQGTHIEITDDLLVLGRTGVTITGDSGGDDALVSGTDITDLRASDPSELDDNTRIFLVSGIVDVTFRDLILTGGRARSEGGKGGAVSSDSPGTGAMLAFDGVMIAGNETTGDAAEGGGVYADAVTLRDSTISGNRTFGADSHGGGLFAFGTATLSNTTVFGNETLGPGANGGGLDIGDGSLINATVTGNKAVGTGGGLQTFESVTSTDSIFVGNEAAEDGARKDVSLGENTGVTFTFDGRNLIGAGSGFESDPAVETAAAEDVFARVVDGAGVLADNGGPTQTVLILAGGAAQDAGTSSRELTDQRGETRPFGEARDIGALELQETASLRVTTAADLVLDDGLTSLREAVAFANLNPGADTITFASGVELIRLTQGTEIEITDTLTIEGGSGVTITGDAGGNDETVAGTDITDLDATDGHNLTDNTRLFNVTAEVDTTFRDLVLTGGRTATDGAGGGGLRSAGSVTLERVTITGNETVADFAGGGGLYSIRAITVTDSTISGNRTSGELSDGGGLYVRDATLTNVTISGNTTSGRFSYGGGLYARDATLTNVTISGNATRGGGSDGGGLSARGDTMFTNVTVSGNATIGDIAKGGGIFIFGGDATLTNVTISDNETRGDSSDGGGLYSGGDATLTNVTISDNETRGDSSEGGGLYSGGDATLIDSIVLGNASVAGDLEIDLFAGDGGLPPGTLIFEGANIVGADTGAFDTRGFANVTNAAPAQVFAQVEGGAGVLADNGGPTETILILLGGAAQDRGTGSTAATDQRGEARPFGPANDIGAVELQEAASLRVTTQADGFRDDGETTLREAVAFANLNPRADTITFDPGVGLIRLTHGTEIEITETLTIEGGAGVTITGDAGGNDETVAGTDITDLDATDGHNLSDNTRLFNVTSEVDTTLRDLVLTGGRTAAISEDGGALRSAGAVTVERVTITGNETVADFSDGGGLYSSRAITAMDSTISGNRTSGERSDGGGLAASGLITVTNSTVSDNATSDRFADGGGLRSNGDVTVTDSTVGGNFTVGEGASGGGVFANGVLTVTNSTISGNSTSGVGAYGGGIRVLLNGTVTGSTISGNATGGENAHGGGVFADGVLAVNNTTVSGNATTVADADGGGLFLRNAVDVTVTNSTITGNSAEGRGGAIYSLSPFSATTTLTDSILLGNNAAGGGAEFATRDAGPPLVLEGLNIVGADSIAFDTTGRGNVVNADPAQVFAQVADGAGVLADNGGPTQTVLILAGGAAQGTGRGATGPDTDQRGVARPQGEGRDIGAVELAVTGQAPLLRDDALVLAFDGDGTISVPLSRLLANDEARDGSLAPGGVTVTGADARIEGGALVVSGAAAARLAGGPVAPDGTGGASVTLSYGVTPPPDLAAPSAEVVLRMAAALRLGEATAEADAGGRAVVDLSALREGGFGEVTISLGPVRATDGGGGGIGSVALSGTDLVFTAGVGSEGRAGAVDVTIVDTLGQMSGATVALEVAEAPGGGGAGGGGGTGGTPDEPGDVDGGGTGGDPARGDGGGGDAPAPNGGSGDGGPDALAPGEGSGDGAPDTPGDTPDAPAPEDGEVRTLLRGTEGRDRIFGTAADERFEGLGARDVLVSGGGDDLMIGGAGPDFFAFARVNAPGTTEVADFGTRDFIVLDDQFFGLGDATIDLRGVALDQVLTAVRAGFVTLDREEGTLSVDPGRDARGEAPELTIALGDGLSDLGVGDVFLA